MILNLIIITNASLIGAYLIEEIAEGYNISLI
jgi:hypothetical protein